MNITAIGQLYQPGRTEYPEGCEYNFFDAGHQLRLFFSNPNKQEIHAVRKGKASFGLLVSENIIFLIFQLKPLRWSDAPYSWWMVPEDRRAEPQEISEGEGALLQIILINANTGIVEAIRAIGLDTDFSRVLHAQIRHQMQKPLAPQEYSNQVDRAYAKYPTSLAMLQNAIAQY